MGYSVAANQGRGKGSLRLCLPPPWSGGAVDMREAPVPQQQRGKVGDLVMGEVSQHVDEPGLRIDVLKFAGLHEREHDRGAFAATIGAGEQP